MLLVAGLEAHSNNNNMFVYIFYFFFLEYLFVTWPKPYAFNVQGAHAGFGGAGFGATHQPSFGANTAFGGNNASFGGSNGFGGGANGFGDHSGFGGGFGGGQPHPQSQHAGFAPMQAAQPMQPSQPAMQPMAPMAPMAPMSEPKPVVCIFYFSRSYVEYNKLKTHCDKN
jgi:hypothetical protein